MVAGKIKLFLTIVLLMSPSTWSTIREFSACHDDFELKPPDGVLKDHTFTWLGFVQYLHVTTGLPHYSKAPRVVLVQRQFALGTVTDMLNLPKNYKLGNIIFGEYDRDEEDCGLTRDQLKMAMTCSRAYIEMPVVEITPHPEFSRFEVGNSLALIKLLRPMKSNYVLPICLPTLQERKRKRKYRYVFMVDYLSNVPIDLDTEKLGKKTLRLYTHKDCRRHRMRARLGSEGVTHMLCTSGCGVRPGAPIVSHAFDGTFELIGIAAGGGVCASKSHRQKLNVEPPLYIDIYPYNTWIINVVTANLIPKPYPEHFRLVEGVSDGNGPVQTRRFGRKPPKEQWRGRTYVKGNDCFKTKARRSKQSFFYTEKFQVRTDPPTNPFVDIVISGGIQCEITCVRVLLPNRLQTPKIEGIHTPKVHINFNTQWFPYSFYFSIGLVGVNASTHLIADRIP